jgi:hypothetical protein
MIKEKLQQAIRKFRLANPQISGWKDDEVIEAMFLIASQQNGSPISVVGRDSDGKLIFEIKRRRGRFGRVAVTSS